jgi:predicted enzyme related to lactoylglutathione lyase
MFTSTRPFSGLSVDDIPAAKKFYGEILGMPVTQTNGMLFLQIGNDRHILVYPKKNHVPAEFTILNFSVDDIDSAVDDLIGRGVNFQNYEETDEKGIKRGDGAPIAWFTDPAGNILSVIED